MRELLAVKTVWRTPDWKFWILVKLYTDGTFDIQARQEDEPRTWAHSNFVPSDLLSDEIKAVMRQRPAVVLCKAEEVFAELPNIVEPASWSRTGETWQDLAAKKREEICPDPDLIVYKLYPG